MHFCHFPLSIVYCFTRLQCHLEVHETSDCCERICLGPSRPWALHVVNNRGFELVRLERPCFCCEETVSVFMADQQIGVVQQDW